MLFIPRKNSFDINELLINNKDIKIIPLTTQNPVIKEIQPEIIKKEEHIKPPTITSPLVKKIKEKTKKKERKSRKRNIDN